MWLCCGGEAPKKYSKTEEFYSKARVRENERIEMQDIEIKRELGSGITGTTHLADWNGVEVALKMMQVTKQQDMPSLMKDFNRELALLQSADHPHICKFIGVAAQSSANKYCLVLEYMDKGSLFEYLRDPNESLDFLQGAKQGALGMQYLHEHCKVLHRDLKSPNLLMNSQGVVKIADFGLTSFEVTSADKTMEIGSYRWMAPEIMAHEDYSFPADVYSYGIIMYEMLTHEMPFKTTKPMQVANGVLHKMLRPVLPEDTPEAVQSLISDCWQKEADKRPTFKEVVERLSAMEASMSQEDRDVLVQIADSSTVMQNRRTAQASQSCTPVKTASPT